MATIAEQIRSMNVFELNALRELIVQEETHRKTEIEDVYGQWFCNIVGVEKIYSLVKVDAKDINLDHVNKYPDLYVKPSMLGDRAAVRGEFNNQPFIALKVDRLDPITKTVIDTVVEIVFKRFKDHAMTYVVPSNILSETEKHSTSFLSENSGLSQREIEVIKGLLEGKEVMDLRDRGFLIRLSR